MSASYLARPGSTVAHIPRPYATFIHGSDGERCLRAMCRETFQRPCEKSYWIYDLKGRHVCWFCARAARRVALRLLFAAEAGGEQ